jgi:hypothetical protein
VDREPLTDLCKTTLQQAIRGYHEGNQMLEFNDISEKIPFDLPEATAPGGDALADYLEGHVAAAKTYRAGRASGGNVAFFNL